MIMLKASLILDRLREVDNLSEDHPLRVSDLWGHLCDAVGFLCTGTTTEPGPIVEDAWEGLKDCAEEEETGDHEGWDDPWLINAANELLEYEKDGIVEHLEKASHELHEFWMVQSRMMESKLKQKALKFLK